MALCRHPAGGLQPDPDRLLPPVDGAQLPLPAVVNFVALGQLLLIIRQPAQTALGQVGGQLRLAERLDDGPGAVLPLQQAESPAAALCLPVGQQLFAVLGEKRLRPVPEQHFLALLSLLAGVDQLAHIPQQSLQPLAAAPLAGDLLPAGQFDGYLVIPFPAVPGAGDGDIDAFGPAASALLQAVQQRLCLHGQAPEGALPVRLRGQGPFRLVELPLLLQRDGVQREDVLPPLFRNLPAELVRQIRPALQLLHRVAQQRNPGRIRPMVGIVPPFDQQPCRLGQLAPVLPGAGPGHARLVQPGPGCLVEPENGGAEGIFRLGQLCCPLRVVGLALNEGQRMVPGSSQRPGGVGEIVDAGKPTGKPVRIQFGGNMLGDGKIPLCLPLLGVAADQLKGGQSAAAGGVQVGCGPVQLTGERQNGGGQRKVVLGGGGGPKLSRHIKLVQYGTAAVAPDGKREAEPVKAHLLHPLQCRAAVGHRRGDQQHPLPVSYGVGHEGCGQLSLAGAVMSLCNKRVSLQHIAEGGHLAAVQGQGGQYVGLALYIVPLRKGSRVYKSPVLQPGAEAVRRQQLLRVRPL